ncbi:MAG: hypothetical protein ABI488_12715 [Polyangiaceae bacterium]
MRYSRALLPTLKEAPANAISKSHLAQNNAAESIAQRVRELLAPTATKAN